MDTQYTPILIQERIKDLRDKSDLTLEQLAERTGLSRSALGSYERDDPKDISLHAVITLAQFYGVTSDYLLGLSDMENHPNADLNDLHLSDKMIELLKSGEINNRLLCEIVTHKEFRNLLADIEIYVDRIASEQIDNLNAVLSVVRAEILTRQNLDKKDIYLRTLETAYIQEEKYFTYTVHEDMDAIIADIRDAHRNDITTADDGTAAAKLKQIIEEAIKFEGSDQERQLQIYCKLLDIPYDELTPEEFTGMISGLQKSKYLRNIMLSRRGRRSMTHGKGKRKKR